MSVGDLAVAIDALRAEIATPGSPVVGDAGVAEIVELRRQIDRLESLWLARVAAVHAAGAAAGQGYVTTAAFLRHACRLAPGDARSRVDVATQLVDESAVAEPFDEGAISYTHAKAILRALAPLPASLQADARPVLIEAARRHDPARLSQIARRLRHIIDPDGQAGLDERRHERRWLEIATSFDGMAILRGVLDPESAATVRTAIEPLSKPAGQDDERTGAQRHADALVGLARLALDAGELPGVGGERPHVTVTVDVAALTGAGAAPGALPNGEPLRAAAARRIACDAIVTRVTTLSANGLADGWQPTPRYLDALPPALRGPTQILDVGRAARTATPAIRKALAVRDKGCVMPGCERPPSHCEAHHVVHWADGGATALHNMALLCWRHHRYVHELGWQIEVRPGGAVAMSPPLADTG